MAEKIVYIALAVSVIGLFILTYSSFVMDPPYSSTGSVGAGSVGKNLRLRGAVTDFHKFKGGSASLSIDDGTGKATVFLDYSISTTITNLSQVKELEVIGPVDLYQGVLEVKPDKADKVRIIS